MATPPGEFSIAASGREGRALLTLSGELDLATAPELEQLVNERLDAGQEVVVDLRGLEFMDSSGIRVLVPALALAPPRPRPPPPPPARPAPPTPPLSAVRPPAATAVAKIVEVSGLDGELNI